MTNDHVKHDLWKFSSSNTAVNIWNSLSNRDVYTAKICRLNKFWQNQYITHISGHICRVPDVMYYEES